MKQLSNFKYAIPTVILLICYQGYSNTIDSLKLVLQKSKDNTEKAKVLNELATQLKWRDIDSCSNYAEQALHYAKLANSETYQARAYNRIGFCYSRKNNQDSALYFYKKALVIYQKNNEIENIGDTYNFMSNVYSKKDMFAESKAYALQSIKYLKLVNNPKKLANSYSNLGGVYLLQENYDSALLLYKETLHYDSISTDTLSINVAITFNDIGGVYFSKGNYPKAIHYYLKALKLFEKFNNNVGISKMLNNIGNIYFEQKNYDKAFTFFENSILIKEKLNDKLGLANTYSSLGKIKLETNSEDEAFEYLFKSQNLFEEINHTRGLSMIYRYLGHAYLIKKNLTQSKMYLERALALSVQTSEKSAIAECYMYLGKISSLRGNHKLSAEQIQKALNIARECENLELEKDIEKYFADAYIEAGMPGKAISHLEQYLKLNDSIYKIENRKIVFDLAQKYESEKKELQLQMANKDKQLKDIEIKKQKLLRNAIIIGIILIMIILLMIFNSAIQQITRKKAYSLD